ncbi:ethanolamine kinase 1-like [Lineus longissimus]|uniref:ethanolamine kinase 1-like n=1 Tax=Lineus longissimus TaxID=88925 RepID=UPI002B4D1395
MAAIPELDIVVDQKNYEKGLRDVLKVVRPTWKSEDIKFKYLTQGYSNHMLACFIDEDNKDDDWIVARIFGTDLDFGQQRDVEVKNSKLFAEREIGPTVYCVFKNGLLFQFIKGKTFFWTDLSAFRDIKLCKAIAREMAKVHCKKTYKQAVEKYNIDKAKNIEVILEELVVKPWPECIIDEETTKWYNSKVPSMEERQKEMKMLMELLRVKSIPKALCHGDCNPTNVIYDEENDKATLVDYEGAGISMPILDIAGFLGSAAYGFSPDPEGLDYTPEFKREFMMEYFREKNKLDGEPEEVDERVLSTYLTMLEIADIGFNYFWHMMATLLATAPTSHGDNSFFLKVGVSRLEYYYKHRERMLAMPIPE